MFVRVIPEKSSGKKLMVVKESYRAEGKSKQRTIKTIGYIEDFLSTYDDPLAHFKAEIKKQSLKDKENKTKKTLFFSPSQTLNLVKEDEISSNRKNLGAAALSHIYHQLEIDYFLNNRRRYTKAKYNHNSIFKLLIYSRILFPSSKRSAFFNKENFFENMDFSLENIYRSMDYFIQWKEDLLIHINNKITSVYGRDTTLLYYDVTNYYFEIDETDDNRKKGVSKEHRPNPIIQMGLFMDEKGLPVNYQLFPGNTNDCKTLIPIMGGTRLNLDIRDIIIVGDKGMMSAENISRIRSQRNGYVISYSLRGSNKEFKDYVLNQSDYEYIDIKDKQRHEQGSANLINGENFPKLKIKSRIIPREIDVPNLKNDKKTKVVINERQIVFYSKKYAEKAKKDRSATLEKAKTIIKNNKKLSKSFGSYKYIKECFIKDDGEIVVPNNTELLFDNEKLAAEEALDGYYVICSNVIGLSENEEPFKGKSTFTKDGYFKLNKSVSDYDIIKMYRGLWEIEETFKITKSTLEVRPVYHTRWDRIECHFLTCFVSLTILRLLEYNLNHKYSSAKIAKSLSKASGTKLEDNYYIFDYYDEILQELQTKFGINFGNKYLSAGEIKKIIGKTKK